MKVPSIRLYQEVVLAGREGTWRINAIDNMKGLFRVRDVPRAFTIATEWDPAPTWINFWDAIEEWDYHFAQSDDPRYYEQHKEMKDALIALFKRLPQQDQHRLQKVLDIVVSVNDK